MIKIKQAIAEKIADIIKKQYPDATIEINDIVASFEYPPEPTMGDISLPCFKFSKALRRSPIQIAASIGSELEGGPIGRVDTVGGYLNMFISERYLSNEVLGEILEKGESFGSNSIGEGKTVVLDYSSPNLAKPFHIGHLGTTVIGHSIKKLHEFSGYKCVGINYVGDWGTQFGKLIVAYKKWGNKEEVEKGGVDALVDLYVRINNAISGNAEQGIPADKALEDEARAEFHKMEMGDEENLALWRWLVDLSLKANEEIYRQLGITFDSYNGESFYTDKMPAQIEKLRETGLLKIDDGASIVDLEEYGMPPCLILKRDGSTLYPTRDIAAAVYRKETYDFDKCIYVTSAGQSLHFAQWFKVVELMGYDWYDKLIHVPYGTVSINGSKLATRTGNVILLRDLFNMAIEKVTEIMKEKNPNITNREETAEAVGVGAIVFYYLLGSRIKDIDFKLEDALSFDGNTGPYVQYTYARTCSILERAENLGVSDTADLKITAPEEATLLKVLARFPEKVISAMNDLEPSVITRYILEVAAEYNRFYHNCQILSAQEPETVAFRVMLTKAARYVLGNAFGLICLKKTPRI